MNPEFRKLKSDFRTYKKMTIALSKYMDKLENENSSLKKSIEGFEGRMLVMAVRLVEHQERIEAIEESLHVVKKIKYIIDDNWNQSELEDAKFPQPRELGGQSLQRNVEAEKNISQFISYLEAKNEEM